jgi:membrane protease YdiL (CAAX protease family)
LKSVRVKRFFLSEIGAAVVWVLCSLTMAAAISPWVYQGGMRLAAMTEAKDVPALLEWLGAACGRAKFGRFFDRTLLFSALVLLPALFRRIRRLRVAEAGGPMDTQVKVSWKSAVIQIVAGCIISGGMLWGLASILEAAGVFASRASVPSAGKLLAKAVVPALVAAPLEEWLFRGLLLGFWLRFTKPLAACFGTSILFAFLHFMKPPAGTIIADPSHVFAGFQLLGKILLHYADPLFFVADFATLLVMGLILAMARVRTGALWFSIGLHAGWIMAFKAFNLFNQDVYEHSLRPWGVGASLRSGIIPLLMLGLTAVVCHFVMRRFSPASR